MRSTQTIDWQFAGLWALSTAAGSFLGGFLGIYAGFNARSQVDQWVGQHYGSNPGMLVAVLVGFAVAAAITALIQQQLLKRKLADTRGWVLFSVLAAAVGAVTMNLLLLFTPIPINPGGVSGGIGIGLAVGAAQGWVLRTQRVRAFPWILANAIAGGLGFRLLNGFAPLMTIAYGLITAGTLIWILSKAPVISR